MVGREGVVSRAASTRGRRPGGRRGDGGESPGRAAPRGLQDPVTQLDGLVLTVEPLHTEHAAPAAGAEASQEGGPPDGLHRPALHRSGDRVGAGDLLPRQRDPDRPGVPAARGVPVGSPVEGEGARAGPADPDRRQGRSRSTSASSTWRSCDRTRSRRTTPRSRSTSSCSTRCPTPPRASIQVGNFAGAAQGIASTTLRAVIGDIPLDDVLAKRDEINTALADQARRGHRALGREGHERRDPRDHPAARRSRRP